MKVNFSCLMFDTSESVFRDQAVLVECMACRDRRPYTACAGRGAVREGVELWAVQYRRLSASLPGRRVAPGLARYGGRERGVCLCLP